MSSMHETVPKEKALFFQEAKKFIEAVQHIVASKDSEGLAATNFLLNNIRARLSAYTLGTINAEQTVEQIAYLFFDTVYSGELIVDPVLLSSGHTISQGVFNVLKEQAILIPEASNDASNEVVREIAGQLQTFLSRIGPKDGRYLPGWVAEHHSDVPLSILEKAEAEEHKESETERERSSSVVFSDPSKSCRLLPQERQALVDAELLKLQNSLGEEKKSLMSNPVGLDALFKEKGEQKSVFDGFQTIEIKSRKKQSAGLLWILFFSGLAFFLSPFIQGWIIYGSLHLFFLATGPWGIFFAVAASLIELVVVAAAAYYRYMPVKKESMFIKVPLPLHKATQESVIQSVIKFEKDSLEVYEEENFESMQAFLVARQQNLTKYVSWRWGASNREERLTFLEYALQWVDVSIQQREADRRSDQITLYRNFQARFEGAKEAILTDLKEEKEGYAVLEGGKEIKQALPQAQKKPTHYRSMYRLMGSVSEFDTSHVSENDLDHRGSVVLSGFSTPRAYRRFSVDGDDDSSETSDEDNDQVREEPFDALRA